MIQVQLMSLNYSIESVIGLAKLSALKTTYSTVKSLRTTSRTAWRMSWTKILNYPDSDMGWTSWRTS